MLRSRACAVSVRPSPVSGDSRRFISLFPSPLECRGAISLPPSFHEFTKKDIPLEMNEEHFACLGAPKQQNVAYGVPRQTELVSRGIIE